MLKLVLAGAAVALAIPFLATMAHAGAVERACLRSDRGASNPAVCGCIQQVADMTLKGGDQRKAAKMMRDPDLAHEVWISKRDADDAFWERYKAFGQQAEAYCS
ncbi:hypothetical protein [Gemmobacter denitrificans]|uniref:TrbM protein n=1 Tax=Gemmobacter denitrificans TaxID=3123040 RepID=A0ABU8BRR2_9RHOB